MVSGDSDSCKIASMLVKIDPGRQALALGVAGEKQQIGQLLALEFSLSSVRMSSLKLCAVDTVNTTKTATWQAKISIYVWSELWN